MHTIIVEIAKSSTDVDPHGWQRVDTLRRTQPVDATDSDDMKRFQSLYQAMENLTAQEPARVSRTVNTAGVVYEFPALQAHEAGTLMSHAGFAGWDLSAMPQVSRVSIRISMA